MKRNYLLFCLFGILICLVFGTVAREAIIDSRKANANQFPYQVSLHELVRKRSYVFFCGGGIIDDLFILTAGHCVVMNNRRIKRISISVVAGTNDMMKTSEPAVIGQVKKIFVINEYAPPKILTGDIAILRLERPLELSRHRHLKALRLPPTKHEAENVHDGKLAEIAGWGWNWIRIKGEDVTGARNDNYLRFAEVDVISTNLCQKDYPARNISKKELCARVKQPDDPFKIRGACEGDGGGPLVHNLTVIGILSVVPDNCSENRTPAIYTRVSSYMTFIDNVMNKRITQYIRERTLM